MASWSQGLQALPALEQAQPLQVLVQPLELGGAHDRASIPQSGSARASTPSAGNRTRPDGSGSTRPRGGAISVSPARPSTRAS